MKIGTRLTLRYTGFTAAVFLLLVAAIYLFSERNRSNEFFRDLKKEGISPLLRGMAYLFDWMFRMNICQVTW